MRSRIGECLRASCLPRPSSLTPGDASTLPRRARLWKPAPVRRRRSGPAESGSRAAGSSALTAGNGFDLEPRYLVLIDSRCVGGIFRAEFNRRSGTLTGWNHQSGADRQQVGRRQQGAIRREDFAIAIAASQISGGQFRQRVAIDHQVSPRLSRLWRGRRLRASASSSSRGDSAGGRLSAGSNIAPPG